MSTAIRLFGGLPGAIIVTALIFLILAAMIRSDQDVVLADDVQISINIGRQLQDRSLQSQQDFQRPVLDQPPPPPPMVHDPSFRPEVAAQIDVPTDFSADLDIGSGFNPDRDAQPLVRIPPQYPQQCMARAQAHEVVTVEFNVTPEGTVVNVEVINTTNSCLNRAAIRAVERWRYAPRVVDGVSQPRFGVRTAIDFNLDEG